MLMLLGCQNFLNVKPQGKILPKAEDEYAAVLNYRLNNLESGTYDQILNNGELIAKYEAYADDLNANINIGNLPIYAGTDFNKNYGIYKDLYGIIKDCNIIIEAMTKFTSEHSKQLMAAAKGIKGACYYNLMSFGLYACKQATGSQRHRAHAHLRKVYPLRQLWRFIGARYLLAPLQAILRRLYTEGRPKGTARNQPITLRRQSVRLLH